MENKCEYCEYFEKICLFRTKKPFEAFLCRHAQNCTSDNTAKKIYYNINEMKSCDNYLEIENCLGCKYLVYVYEIDCLGCLATINPTTMNYGKTFRTKSYLTERCEKYEE